MIKKKKLETFPFNLYCTESKLPMSLHGSKKNTNGPHLQKQARKPRILLLPDKLEVVLFCFKFIFFEANLNRSN